MIEYKFLDETNRQKSIAVFEGVELEFWYLLFSTYGKEEVEVFLKAEAKLLNGEGDTVVELIAPYLSGENSIEKVETTDEEGNVSITVTGEDTRSFLKKWYDSKF